MTDVLPISLPLADPPRRDGRIVATVAVSVAVHLLVLGLLLLPRTAPPPPADPSSIDVELVPPEAASSVEPSTPPSQAEGSSEAPPSGAPSSEMASAETSAAESSAEEAPPSAEPSTAAEAAAKPAAEAADSPSQPPPPAMPHARPLVIPVGPGADPSEPVTPATDASASAEASSAEPSADASAAPDATGDAPVLAVDAGGAGDASPAAETAADAAPPPIDKGLLRASKRFYLDAMLDSQGMAKAREALKKLPPEKRLAQTCNIEAIAQIGNARQDLSPDALIANAFAVPVATGTTYSVGNGAFRSTENWYSVAYECTLSDDLSAVTAFAFHVGGDVTSAMQARFGAKKP